MKTEQDTTPEDEATHRSNGPCTHRDMAGDSAIEAINEHTWCTICGAAGPSL